MSTLFFNNKKILLIKRVLAEASFFAKSYVGCKHFIGKSKSFIPLANFSTRVVSTRRNRLCPSSKSACYLSDCQLFWRVHCQVTNYILLLQK